MIKPSRDDYYAVTDVFRHGPLEWAWSVTLRQPWPAYDTELAEDGGWALTEKRAKRKADRVARQMMRAAASWIRTTYNTDGTTEEQP